MATSAKFIPGSDATSEEIFTYPFFIHEESKEFIKSHKKIMFIIRGPPGTGKFSLTKLMITHFPRGVKCSADDYFSNTFNPSSRNRDSLKQSHFYCHRKVKQECIKNSHPVIVSNTHMKKHEMQEYLNIAAEYEYTVIICSTLDKFEVSPDILAKTNTKGLNKQYFERRLKAWEDVFPTLMGWFLCPDDSFYILHQLQCALTAVLQDGKFCRDFKAFDTDTLLNNYKAKTLLCCMAGCVKSNQVEFNDYYKSAEVRNSYGKCFTISIQAFVVTKSNIFAVVQLENHLKSLIFKPNFENSSYTEKDEDDVENIVDIMQRVSLESAYNFKFLPLKNEFSQNPKTVKLVGRCDDDLNITDSSFIHVAQREEKIFSAYELNQFYRKSFMGISGKISADQFNAMEDGYIVHRLENDGWVIQVPKNLSVNTVFTGLYI